MDPAEARSGVGGGDQRPFCPVSSYLWVGQPPQVGVKVELDPDGGPRQREASDQQHDQHQVREGGGEVDHLEKSRKMSLESSGSAPPPEEGRITHLPGGFHPLPDAEVAHDPGQEQTQGQVPVQGAHLVQARGDPQGSPPVGGGGLGYGTQVIVTLLNFYYIVVLAWGIFYLSFSFSWDLPWSSCNNTWNTGSTR
ncbi:unnamed protein product [Menidia menidia]|uniref:(Atlantic silverside) hypothetical protein n=1 Tax=Menidia menidia TaxID=238744 RepID=A0A8S4B039_9TELE|nr:unnamed protein product [Menidia menidia]